MCQMPNIWHIYHTKYKNDALWDVPNFKNYTTWLQYRCKFATVRTNVVKNLLFYILFSLSSLFIFSFLFSLTLRFPLSSPYTCQEENSGADSDYRRAYPPWSTGTTRGWDSASKVKDHRRDWTLRVPATLDQPHSISPTLQPRSILPISPRGRRRSSSLSSLSALHSGSLWLWVFYFFYFFYFFLFFTVVWVDLMVVVDCGLWAVTVAMVVDCGGDGRWWLSVSLMIMGWDNILF